MTIILLVDALIYLTVLYKSRMQDVHILFRVVGAR